MKFIGFWDFLETFAGELFGFANRTEFSGTYGGICEQSLGFCEALAISAASSRRNCACAVTPVQQKSTRLFSVTAPAFEPAFTSELTLIFARSRAIFRASNPKNRLGLASCFSLAAKYDLYALSGVFGGIEPPKTRDCGKLRFPQSLLGTPRGVFPKP